MRAKRSALIPSVAGLVALLTGCVALLVVTRPVHAESVGGCDEAFHEWLVACAARNEGVLLAEDHCANGVAVIAASSAGRSLRIELGPARPSSPIRVGDIAIAPIGDFPDWQGAPEPFRRSFDAVRACVRERAPILLPTTQSAAVAGYGFRCALTWAGIVLFVIFMIAAAPRRSRSRDAAYASSAMALAALVRRVAIEPAFFHQNGHGAGWVLMAQCLPSTYGPGYAALFHPAAMWGGAHAEYAVFATQEILAAIAVGAVFALARNLGNTRPVAWASAMAIGIEPFLGRLARSESYFATSLWLIVMALAALSATWPPARPSDVRTWVGAALGGFLLATAVTVHPVAWVPAAFAPAVLVLRADDRRERIAAALVAGTVIAVTMATIALPAVVDVMHGALGAQWAPVSPQGGQLMVVGGLLAAPWIVGLTLPSWLVGWIAPVLLVADAVMLDRRTNLLGVDARFAPADAWRTLFAVTAFAGVLALLARCGSAATRHLRWAPVALASIVGISGVAHALTTFRSQTMLPTDALETAVFAPRLQSLPSTARLFHLERSGTMMQELPVYSVCGFAGPEVLRLSATEPPRAMLPGDYWFHSATCSSTLGRSWCAAMEAPVVLRPLHVERFPARVSLDPFDAPEIVSGLYYVEALRRP